MSLASLLNATCTIARQTDAASSLNAATLPTWSTTTGVACSIQVDTSTEARQYGRDTGKVQYRVFFAFGTDVRHGDRINTVVVSGTAWSGREFAVTSAPQDHAGRGAYVMVTGEEVIGGPQA